MLLNCAHMTHLVKLYLGEAKCYAEEHWRGLESRVLAFLRTPY